MFGGNFRKFGTDSNGISGTFCAFALLCAKLGTAARSSPAARAPAVKHLFIEASGTKVEGIYTSASNGSSLARTICEAGMLGLRLNDEERRHADRRTSARGTHDRRRGPRRLSWVPRADVRRSACRRSSSFSLSPSIPASQIVRARLEPFEALV